MTTRPRGSTVLLVNRSKGGIMLSRHRWFTLAATAVATLALASTATPANAVVGGTDDTANRYQNVGMLQLRDDDDWFAFCSGTLVADNVVLTAAHCLDFFTADVGEDGLGPDDLRVSFDVAPDEDSTYYVADHVVVHPDWLTAGPCLGNSKHLCLAPPAEDIGLIFLRQDVSGVTPAQLAPAGYLDTLDLTHETFTVVGYGTDAFITGSAGSPKAITIFDGVRSFRDVTVITTHDAFPDRHLKITQSVCFGDSGGPLFHGDILVALNTWTFSYRCDGPNLEYRVDAAAAQEFLSAYL
jgi:Trypsin